MARQNKNNKAESPPLIIQDDKNLDKLKPKPGQKIIMRFGNQFFEIKIEGGKYAGILGVA